MNKINWEWQAARQSIAFTKINNFLTLTKGCIFFCSLFQNFYGHFFIRKLTNIFKKYLFSLRFLKRHCTMVQGWSTSKITKKWPLRIVSNIIRFRQILKEKEKNQLLQYRGIWNLILEKHFACACTITSL